MVLLTFIDYFAGIMIENAQTKGRKKLALGLSLTANLSLLFFFKYYNFFSSQFNEYLNGHLPLLDIVLPLGISFHTFQAMSYTIDVYLGRQKAERHLGYFALFIAYFPQMVAGPIERSQHLQHQLKQEQKFDYARGAEGFRLMLWGFFKKLVIADNLAVLVDAAYNSPQANQGWFLLLATYCFAFQILCDFSGYTDIARGAAQIMGINLVENFRRPYFAKSVQEFWQRWHMSLSTWFRDYVYIPLCGSKTPSLSRRLMAVMVVFTVSGLWHGANWTFIVWGALNGLFYMVETITKKQLAKVTDFELPKWAQVFITFNLICVTWVFFRANNVTEGFFILQQIGKSFFGMGKSLIASIPLNVSAPTAYGLFGVLILLYANLLERKTLIQTTIGNQVTAVRWTLYVALAYGTIILGNVSAKQFIYFQF
ncbi:MAG: hypothetical protein A4S09_02510 [Proteobacteria bacterium SG_bin7]|nr:MAG: hypothetical protein A4S09_02510 [Proteobacteria bacterium SG_bin7]